MTDREKHYDALVVGARCAGAATAMLMARVGMRVLLVDWAEPGTDTMSTHALMRGAVMQLARWGLVDALKAAGTPEVTKTTFFYGDEAVPVAIRPAHGTTGLMAPRRHLLDRKLVAAAVAAGVDVRFGTAFREVVRDGDGRVVGATLKTGRESYEVRARLVVGADGRRSTVAERVGAGFRHQSIATTACVYAYVEGLRDDGYRWYYAPELGAGAIPTNDGQHCVFASAKFEVLRAEIARNGPKGALSVLAEATSPSLGAELRGRRIAEPPVVFRGAPGFIRASAGPGWALVGDAGYFKDPLTAHGITDALRDAEILARAAAVGSDRALADYEATRDTLSHDLYTVTEEIARLDLPMPELKAAHLRLNEAMKAEQTFIAEAFASPQLAA